jgi:hypothetical protein
MPGSREHGGATGENNVGVEIATDVDIALHDSLESAIVDTRGSLLSNQRWLEENFWATESYSRFR